ncbi:MAG: ABC transporter permease [Synergistales bacterium]
MKSLRWSMWVLLILLFSGFVLPLFLAGDPRQPVASPFAKPAWVDRKQPPAMVFPVPSGEGRTVPWSWEAPRGLSISGEVVFAAVPSEARLIWETPSGDLLVLADLSGQRKAVLDLDARDMAFRASLGLSPFDESLEGLFGGHGKIRVRIESETPVESSTLSVRIPGERWGLFGTDQRGRDVFRLFLAGIRVSLLVGILAVLVSTLIGLTAGLFGGYVGGVADALLMRTVDVLLSIPILPILMVLAALWGKGLWQLVLILGLFSWMGTARTVRSMTLSFREAPYVEGLRALGAPTPYILIRHGVPTVLPLLLANIALGVPGVILSEAALAYLGLSDPRVISWGRMLHEAQSFGAFTSGAWWLLLPPGLGIALLCLVFMDLGRALEEWADPRLKGGKA